MRKARLLKLLAILFAFALIAAACGGDDDDDPVASGDDAAEPADEPSDEPADEPADEPGDEPADEPSDEPADEPSDEPADIGPPEIDTLRICQAPAFTGLAAAVSVNQGFLADRGITGEFIACESGPANAAALIAGEVEFVGNTPDNMLGIRNADFDVVMFAQAVDKHFFDIIVSSNFGEIDCPAGDWECTMAALDGTNVGVVARGAAAEQIARQLYDSAGLDPDNATYIATGLAGTTLAALSSGEVDWAITFEPGLSQGVLDGIGSTEILQMFISNRPGRVRPGSSGEIVPGYEARIVGADLVVLDRSLFDIPATEISEVQVLQTLIEGEVVYPAR